MPDINPVAIPTVLLDQNWLDDPVMESNYSTQIDSFESADEVRAGLTGKPSRMLTHSGITLARNDTGRLLNHIRLGTAGRYYYPLSQDETMSIGVTANGSTAIACVTANRRFFVGNKLMAVAWDASLKALLIHVATITAISTNSISIDPGEAFPSEFPEASSVYPAIEAEVALSQEASVVTDRHLTFSLRVNERVGETALPPLVEPGTFPADEPGYRTLPILAIRENAAKSQTTGKIRRATATPVGTDVIYDIKGPTSLTTAQLTFDATNRAEAFRVLRFFDSRGGALFPFWFPNRSTDFTVIAKTSTTVFQVEKSLSTTDFLAQQFVAFWTTTTVAVRRIISVTDAGTHLNLTIDEAVTHTAAEIIRSSWACLARFDTDSIRESWMSKEVMTVTVPIVGLNASSNAGCVGNNCEGGCGAESDCPEPGDPTTGDLPEPPWVPDPMCWASAADIPMMFDCTQALNSGREPIRAADYTMPFYFKVSVKRGMVQDTNHPHAAPMSEELAHELYREHVVEFQGAVERTTSSNPYHTRVNETLMAYSLEGSPIAVHEESPYWEKEVEYVVGEGEEAVTHTLHIRLYVEWVERGGGMDQDVGAWGALLCVVAWSTEISPTYVDGTEFAPFEDIEFNIEDPMVSGGYHGLSVGSKFFHPSLLFAAMFPTTWHAPAGYYWHAQDRDARLHECFRAKTGAPWGTDGGPQDAIRNSVFGTGGGLHAAMTIGGWTTSELYDWLCIENQRGEGRTYLKPTRAGWDENLGGLTSGNDITITGCTPIQTPISGCDGHPLDKAYNTGSMEGGTHSCWRTGADTSSGPDLDKFLCVPAGRKGVFRPAGRIAVNEQCISIKDCFTDEEDGFSPGRCKGDPDTPPECHSYGIPTALSVPLHDYSFAFGAPGDSRNYQMIGYVDDPDYEDIDWELDPEDPTTFDDWAPVIGSWDLDGETMTITALGGSGVVHGYVEYVAGDIEDGSIEALLPPVAGFDVALGLGIRIQRTGATITKGFLAVEYVDEGLMRLWRVDSGTTRTLLASAPLSDDPGFNGGTRMLLSADGSKITVTWEDRSLSAHDCEQTDGGKCGLIVEGTDAGFDFRQVQVGDNNWRKVTGQIFVGGGIDQIDAGINDRACHGYTSSCKGCSNPDCTGDYPDGCDCCSTCKQVFGVYTVDSDNYPSGNASPIDSGWNPPSDVGPCDEEPCGDGPNCNDCPPPFQAISASLPGNCASVDHPSASLFTKGVAAFYWSEVVCS